MAEISDANDSFLALPAVQALRQGKGGLRGQMERTISMDIREEREDLKEAAEHSLNVILDLGLDGIVRWVSPSWKDVIGTPPEDVKGKPIAEVLLRNKDAFADVVESMKKDDTRSKILRFSVQIGPLSVLKQEIESPDGKLEAGILNEEAKPNEEDILDLEGQGIMVYDRSSGGESHVSAQRQSFLACDALILSTDHVDAATVYPAKGNNY